MPPFKSALLASGATLVLASAAGTGNAKAATVATTTQNGETKLEEVVVTAQRRSESGQRVPVPITSIGASQLRARGVASVTDLQFAVPSLQTATAGNSVTTFLRGVGSVVNAPGADPEVALYVDGVYFPSPAASNFAFNNIASIEVDKGPQGTLFGRNATAGVIQVTTLEPSHTPRFDMSVGYGNYNTNTQTLYLSDGITQNLAADIAIYRNDQLKGWGHNVDTGASIYTSRDEAMRSKWVYTPTDDTKFTLIVDYENTRGFQGAALNQVNGLSVTGGKRQPFFDVNDNIPPYEKDEQYGISLKAEHDFGPVRVLSITADRRTNGFLQLDTDQSPVPAVYLTAPQTQQTFTQELQILSPDASTIKWIVGGYFLHDRSGVDPLELTEGATSFLNNTYQITDSVSAFGQTTIPLFPKLVPDTHLVLGLRYTNDVRQEENSTSTATGFSLPGDTGYQKTNDGNFSYRASLDHTFTPNTFGYVSYDRGFKSGLYSTTSSLFAPNTGPAVKPETIDAYQAGVKNTFFDHRFRFGVDGFYYTYNNLQETTFTEAGPILFNAASAKIAGVDLDADVVPMKNVTLSASMTALDAHYSAFKTATFYRPPPSGLGLVSYEGDATGNRLPFAPHLSATVNAQYRLPTDVGPITFNTSVSYKSAYFFEPQNLVRQAPFTMVNASIRWAAPGGRYDLTLWGKNLANKKWYAMAGASAAGGEYYSAGDPLTFGVTAGLHFR